MSRPRGRPPKSDDPATRDRLLAAATEACVEVGFEAVRVADVAARAGVTPAAVYNHSADKEELLYTAGRVAIDRLKSAIDPATEPDRMAQAAVAAFLSPSFRTSRRLILELHLAAARHRELGEHVSRWHREFASLAAEGPVDVKVFFLLLLGCCHVDDLHALDAPAAAVEERMARLVDQLFASSG